jgi:hypothetical protein
VRGSSRRANKGARLVRLDVKKDGKGPRFVLACVLEEQPAAETGIGAERLDPQAQHVTAVGLERFTGDTRGPPAYRCRSRSGPAARQTRRERYTDSG